MAHDFESTRQSWNVATKNHNRHKGEQAAFIREGGELLFPEELTLLGHLKGRSVVHLQCNSGQDSLCLARAGAKVVGVDLSDEAISFAQSLSIETGINASFIRDEVVSWMSETDQQFDLAFASYGVVGWLPDLRAWASGVACILKPGGRLVYVDFHPLVWSWGDDLRPTRDDYFYRGPYVEPVGDYVAQAGASLGASTGAESLPNSIPAHGWQYGLGDIVSALIGAGLTIDHLAEYPYSNGAKVVSSLVQGPNRTWVWPDSVVRTPLMFSLVASKS